MWHRRTVIVLSLLCFVFTNMMGCAPAVVVKEPPAPKLETKPPKPFPRAVWIDGHWKWNSAANNFLWVSGRWVREKAGKVWIQGHWKRTSGGWKWVKGHWR